MIRMMFLLAWRRRINGDTTATRKAALWVGVVFLLGAALGGMLGYVFAHHTAMAAPAQMTDSEKRAQKVQRLTQELNLSPDQQKQLDTIMASVQAQYKAIHQSTDPQTNEARQKGENRFARFSRRSRSRNSKSF